MNQVHLALLLSLATLSLFGGDVLYADDDAANKADKSTKMPPSQAEIKKLLRDFYDAGKDHAKRLEVVEQAAQMGSTATKRLQLIFAKDLFKQMDNYGKSFTGVAAKISNSRASQINPVQIAAMREQFLSLRKAENLSKEAIKSQGDPIVQQLEKMLVIDSSEVLANTKLSSQRERLQQIGKLWERCAIVTYEELVESIDDEEQRKYLTRPSFEKFLDSEEQIAARLALPMPPQDRAILAANARIASKLERDEAKAVLSTNLLRILVGLSPCAIDLRLAAAARDHSADMQRLNFFDHVSPIPSKKSFTQRANNFRTTASAENIAINGGGGPVVVKAWYYSPGHHKNVFGGHKRIGVGKTGRYWTQMFGR